MLFFAFLQFLLAGVACMKAPKYDFEPLRNSLSVEQIKAADGHSRFQQVSAHPHIGTSTLHSAIRVDHQRMMAVPSALCRTLDFCAAQTLDSGAAALSRAAAVGDVLVCEAQGCLRQVAAVDDDARLTLIDVAMEQFITEVDFAYSFEPAALEMQRKRANVGYADDWTLHEVQWNYDNVTGEALGDLSLFDPKKVDGVLSALSASSVCKGCFLQFNVGMKIDLKMKVTWRDALDVTLFRMLLHGAFDFRAAIAAQVSPMAALSSDEIEFVFLDADDLPGFTFPLGAVFSIRFSPGMQLGITVSEIDVPTIMHVEQGLEGRGQAQVGMIWEPDVGAPRRVQSGNVDFNMVTGASAGFGSQQTQKNSSAVVGLLMELNFKVGFGFLGGIGVQDVLRLSLKWLPVLELGLHFNARDACPQTQLGFKARAGIKREVEVAGLGVRIGPLRLKVLKLYSKEWMSVPLYDAADGCVGKNVISLGKLLVESVQALLMAPASSSDAEPYRIDLTVPPLGFVTAHGPFVSWYPRHGENRDELAPKRVSIATRTVSFGQQLSPIYVHPDMPTWAFDDFETQLIAGPIYALRDRNSNSVQLILYDVDEESTYVQSSFVPVAGDYEGKQTPQRLYTFWSPCDVPCGKGQQTRTSVCVDTDSIISDDSLCADVALLPLTQTCDTGKQCRFEPFRFVTPHSRVSITHDVRVPGGAVQVPFVISGGQFDVERELFACSHCAGVDDIVANRCEPLGLLSFTQNSTIIPNSVFETCAYKSDLWGGVAFRLGVRARGSNNVAKVALSPTISLRAPNFQYTVTGAKSFVVTGDAGASKAGESLSVGRVANVVIRDAELSSKVLSLEIDGQKTVRLDIVDSNEFGRLAAITGGKAPGWCCDRAHSGGVGQYRAQKSASGSDTPSASTATTNKHANNVIMTIVAIIAIIAF